MLPFLKKNQESSTASNSEPVTRKPDEGGEYDGLHACAEDLISAVHSKNVAAVASALKAAFEICDASPHEEGPHI